MAEKLPGPGAELLKILSNKACENSRIALSQIRLKVGN